jgi:hypothetical protein
MNTLEDRIRAAVVQTAEEIAPGSIRPLSLHGQGPVGRRTRTGRAAKASRGSARWPRVLIPIAAAASVIAVVAASLAITGNLSEGRSAVARAHAGQPGTGRSQPGKAPQIASAASRAALASVPEFYVAMTPGGMGMNNRAQVRATATGAVLATVAAPAPYNTFSWVSAAADDRTFVLAAQEWTPIPPGNAGGPIEQRDDDSPTKFFALHLSSDGRTVRLSALPIPVQPGSVWIDGIALSPDGSKLAVVISSTGAPVDGNTGIAVYTVATGARKKWVWMGGDAVIGNQKPWGSPLSWAADGRTLAFQIVPANGTIEVRLLDTDAPGGAIASRLAVEWRHGDVAGANGVVINGGSGANAANSLGSYNTLITPDGTKIVCLTTGTTVNGVTEFDAATARVVSDSYPQGTDVLWTNSSGSTLIVSNATTVGVLTGGHFTPLPDASNVDIMSAW